MERGLATDTMRLRLYERPITGPLVVLEWCFRISRIHWSQLTGYCLN